jgi:hypothetical protein
MHPWWSQGEVELPANAHVLDDKDINRCGGKPPLSVEHSLIDAGVDAWIQ